MTLGCCGPWACLPIVRTSLLLVLGFCHVLFRVSSSIERYVSNSRIEAVKRRARRRHAQRKLPLL